MVKIRIIESKPALVLQNQKRYLIISDLHIGFEDTFSSNKIFLGKNSSTSNIIDDIKILIQNESIESLILLGDVNLDGDINVLDVVILVNIILAS